MGLSLVISENLFGFENLGNLLGSSVTEQMFSSLPSLQSGLRLQKRLLTDKFAHPS